MKKIAILVVLVFYSCIILGQGTIALPPTPESQSLLKAVNMQMNKATGIMGFSIPLCEIGEGDLCFPVTLSYTCAAIKVQDIASWVGTGWNLSAGGKITRVIVDNDDLQGGYCRGQGVLANDMNSWWNGGAVKKDRKDEHSGNPCTGCKTFDGEPDLFYYEIPGRSGMFVIDQNGIAWTIPYSNVKIELKNDDTFLVTDESGRKYYFDLKEITRKISHSDRAHAGTSDSPYGEKSKVVNYVSTWHLTRVQNLFGEEIRFSYVQNGTSINYENNNYTRLNNKAQEDLSVHFRTTPYYLQEISWSSGRIQFFSSLERPDMAGCRQLNELKIYSTGNEYRKSVKFTYSRFASQRLCLDKIEEESSGLSVTIGKYTYFTDCNLPGRNSKDIDHWGYYNGKNNSSWFPAEGASREPVLSYTRANMLKMAYNSMGGYTEYVYEANTLANGSSVGGVRIKSIQIGDANGNVQTINYTYSGGTSFNTYTIYSNNMGSGNVLKYMYSTINLHDTGGSNVYYATVTENLPNGSKIISNYTTYADCDDVRSLYYINPSESNENMAISLFPNSSRFWRRGLLKSEIHKNAVGTEVKRVENTYHFPVVPKNRIKGFFLQSSVTYLNHEIDHVSVYDWLSEVIYLVADTTTDTRALNTRRRITYDTVYCVPVEERVNCQNGDVYRTVTKYAFSYGRRSNPDGDVENNAIDLLLASGLPLTPIEQVEYKNGKIIGGELFIYRGLSINNNVNFPVLDRMKCLISLPIEETNFIMSTMNVASQFIHDSRYEMLRVCDEYDSRGRLLSWHDGDGIQRSVVYPEISSTPVAIVENARYAMKSSGRRNNQVFHTSFEEHINATFLGKDAKTGKKVYFGTYEINLQGMIPGNYTLSYWKRTAGGRSWEYIEEPLTVTTASLTRSIGERTCMMDEVRIIPAKAVITTYTCVAGVGQTSVMDTNGITVYYEYDVLGRLLRVLNNERKIVKEYEYFVNFK